MSGKFVNLSSSLAISLTHIVNFGFRHIIWWHFAATQFSISHPVVLTISHHQDVQLQSAHHGRVKQKIDYLYMTGPT
jgi:hypothetical protein